MTSSVPRIARRSRMAGRVGIRIRSASAATWAASCSADGRVSITSRSTPSARAASTTPPSSPGVVSTSAGVAASRACHQPAAESLWIEVDQHRPPAGLLRQDGEMDGQRGLTAPALPAQEADYLHGPHICTNRRLRKRAKREGYARIGKCAIAQIPVYVICADNTSSHAEVPDPVSVKTEIAWCDHTFSPWSGCTQVDRPAVITAMRRRCPSNSPRRSAPGDRLSHANAHRRRLERGAALGSASRSGRRAQADIPVDVRSVRSRRARRLATRSTTDRRHAVARLALADEARRDRRTSARCRLMTRTSGSVSASKTSARPISASRCCSRSGFPAVFDVSRCLSRCASICAESLGASSAESRATVHGTCRPIGREIFVISAARLGCRCSNR